MNFRLPGLSILSFFSFSVAAQTSTNESYSDTIQGVVLVMKHVKGGAYDLNWIRPYEIADESGPAAEKSASHKQIAINSFYMSETEVTRALWKAVMDHAPSIDDANDCDQCPVTQVSWNDAQQFITRLSAITGRQYRLPSHEEWEYAAAGGTASKAYKYAGGDDMTHAGWYEENSEQSARKVKTREPNELGLYDMSGNVWEWCNDWWADSYDELLSDKEKNKKGKYRMIMGGSWQADKSDCRVGVRLGSNPEDRSSDVGIRLVGVGD